MSHSQLNLGVDGGPQDQVPTMANPIWICSHSKEQDIKHNKANSNVTELPRHTSNSTDFNWLCKLS